MEHGGSPHVGEGRTNSEGSLACQEVPDLEATIEDARAVSNVLMAVARIDMEYRLDPPSQGRQSVQERTRKCQPARARILERPFVTKRGATNPAALKAARGEPRKHELFVLLPLLILKAARGEPRKHELFVLLPFFILFVLLPLLILSSCLKMIC